MSMHSEFGDEHVKHASINCQDRLNLSQVIGDIFYQGFEQFEQEVVFRCQKLEHENFSHSHPWSGFIFGVEKLVIKAAQLVNCNSI